MKQIVLILIVQLACQSAEASSRQQAARAVQEANRAVRDAEQSLKNFAASIPETSRSVLDSSCKGKDGISFWACAYDSIQSAPLPEPFQTYAKKSFQEFLKNGPTSQSALERCHEAVSAFQANPPQIADEVERHMEARKPKPVCPAPMKVLADWSGAPALTEAAIKNALEPPPVLPKPAPVVAAKVNKPRPVSALKPKPKPTPVVEAKVAPTPSATPSARPKIITIDQTEETDRLVRAWQARQARHFEFARESLAKLEQVLAQAKQVKELPDEVVLFESDTRARFVSAQEDSIQLARAAYLVDRWLELDVHTAVVSAQWKGAEGYWVVRSPGSASPTAEDAPTDSMLVLDYLIGFPDRRSVLDTWAVVGRARRPVALSAQGGFLETSAVPVQDAARIIASDPRRALLFSEAQDAKLFDSLKDLLAEEQLSWLKKRLELLRDRVKILSNFTRSS